MKYGTAMALGGIAQGVERGIGLGMQIGDYKDRKEARKLDRAERKEDKAYDRQRQATQDKRQVDLDRLDKRLKELSIDQKTGEVNEQKYEAMKDRTKYLLASLISKPEGTPRTVFDPLTPNQRQDLSAFAPFEVTNAGLWFSEDQKPDETDVVIFGIEEDGNPVSKRINLMKFTKWLDGSSKGKEDEYNASENKRKAERGAREDKTREGLGGSAEKLKKLISQRDTALANGDKTLAAELSLEIQKLEASMAAWKGEIDVMSGGGATPPAGVGMGTAPVAPAAAPAQQPAADQASAQPVPSNYAVTNPRWRTTVADLITMARKKPELAKAPEAEVLAYLENEKFIEAVN